MPVWISQLRTEVEGESRNPVGTMQINVASAPTSPRPHLLADRLPDHGVQIQETASKHADNSNTGDQGRPEVQSLADPSLGNSFIDFADDELIKWSQGLCVDELDGTMNIL